MTTIPCGVRACRGAPASERTDLNSRSQRSDAPVAQGVVAQRDLQAGDRAVHVGMQQRRGFRRLGLCAPALAPYLGVAGRIGAGAGAGAVVKRRIGELKCTCIRIRGGAVAAGRRRCSSAVAMRPRSAADIRRCARRIERRKVLQCRRGDGSVQVRHEAARAALTCGGWHRGRRHCGCTVTRQRQMEGARQRSCSRRRRKRRRGSQKAVGSIVPKPGRWFARLEGREVILPLGGRPDRAGDGGEGQRLRLRLRQR